MGFLLHGHNSPQDGPRSGCLIVFNGTPKFLPLNHLDAKVSIFSSSSRTTLTQTFTNPMTEEVKEARYVFPMFDGVSVVSFTCTIGSRVIRGVVKERQEARKAFDDAVSQGRTAGLLEQSQEASDVFTTTLGNIPAQGNVNVEITYLGELKHDAEMDGLRFTIPTSIAPRYGDSSLGASSITASGARISVTVDAEFPQGSSIRSIQSPSHPISINVGATSAAPNAPHSPQRVSVNLSVTSAELGKDFILQIAATGLGDPLAVLETHPTLPNQRALMATLVPRFNLPVQKPEVVFLCDRSGSMGGVQKIPNLVAAMGIFLKSLPVGVRFNICSFGTRFTFLWDKSQPYDQASLEKAIAHIRGFDADYGGTEIQRPMEEAFRRRHQDMNLEVILITDGEVWQQTAMFQSINAEVAQSNGSIRVFTLGIGTDVSHAFIQGVARAGRGFAQTVSEDEKMDKKLVRMLKGALTPHVGDYTLEIRYEKEGSPRKAAGSDDGDDNDDSDGFELVEKVMDAMTIDVPDEVQENLEQEEQKIEKTTISLFDETVKDKDLEMPDATALPAVKLPAVIEPRYLQTPYDIPPLFPFIRTTVYVLLSDSTPACRPKSVLLRGTCDQAALELEIPILALAEEGTTIHQLAAKKEIGELEEGHGWIYHAKTEKGRPFKQEFEAHLEEMVKREAVRLGVQYQVGGKWCSFVAVHDGEEHDADQGGQTIGEFEVTPAAPQTRQGLGGMMGAAGVRMQMHAPAAYNAPPAWVQPTASALAISAFAPAISAFAPAISAFAPAISAFAPAISAFAPAISAFVGFLYNGRSPGRREVPRDPVETSDDARRRPTNLYKRRPKVKKSDWSSSSHQGMSAAGDTTYTTSSSEEVHEAFDDTQPVSLLAQLQTFNGSWKWDSQLEGVLGVSREQASGADLPARYDDHDEVLATLCAVVFLRKRLAAEKETWELFVEKAEDWLLAKTEADVKALEEIVEAILFA